jgi:hypothetical protein
VRVRELTGYDQDGRVYQIVRVHGAAEPTVTVLRDQSPDKPASKIIECLQRLVTAHCATPGDERTRLGSQ